jgi:nucleotide-binding universal stress UspA family protein
LLLRANLLEGELPGTSRIVVPLDGSPRSESALTVAARLATGLAVPIRLVRAITMDEVLATARRKSREPVAAAAGEAAPSSDEPYDVARQETEAAVTEYLAGHAEALRASGLQVDIGVLHGTPAFSLLDTIEEDDLVILTSHGQGGYKRWLLGSVAEKLVREAKSPVLLVPSRVEQD